MLATDRKHYAQHFPYEDAPQPIGYGMTISAPHMHAAALEHLGSQLGEGNKALVGTTRSSSVNVWGENYHGNELISIVSDVP